jgi:hypothetical protein
MIDSVANIPLGAYAVLGCRCQSMSIAGSHHGYWTPLAGAFLVAPFLALHEAVPNGLKNGFSLRDIKEPEPFCYCESKHEKTSFYRLLLSGTQ